MVIARTSPNSIDRFREKWYDVPVQTKPIVTQLVDADPARKVGFLSAIAAFVLWGCLPLYWAQIATVPALEIVGHRVFWGGLLAWAVVLIRRRWAPAAEPPVPIMPRGSALRWLLFNGVLVVSNWVVYVWAVSSGRTLDASLGYYINPLVNVFLGMIFFGERLTRMQWVALASAATGVLFLTIRLGVIPWVSLTLAFTFGIYGLIKKRSQLASIHSLAVEMMLVAPIAGVFLTVLGVSGRGQFLAGNPLASFFLWGAGVVTILPLLLFGIAARRIRLADVGFMQYIAPTIMFIVAIAVFGDPLEPARLVGFIFVWIGLAIYSTTMRK